MQSLLILFNTKLCHHFEKMCKLCILAFYKPNEFYMNSAILEILCRIIQTCILIMFVRVSFGDLKLADILLLFLNLMQPILTFL